MSLVQIDNVMDRLVKATEPFMLVPMRDAIILAARNRWINQNAQGRGLTFLNRTYRALEGAAILLLPPDYISYEMVKGTTGSHATLLCAGDILVTQESCHPAPALMAACLAVRRLGYLSAVAAE